MLKKVIMLMTVIGVLALTIVACAPKNDQGQETIPQKNINYTELLLALEESENPTFSNFKSIDISGKTVSQELFLDSKITMVNIWATFCPPCLKEMPELGEIAAEYAEKGVKIVGIVTDVQERDGSISNKQVDLAKSIIQETKADYLHILPSNDLYYAKLADVVAVPETVFLDKDGNVLGKPYLGSRDKEGWIKIIEELLDEVE